MLSDIIIALISEETQNNIVWITINDKDEFIVFWAGRKPDSAHILRYTMTVPTK